ncbi:MAG: hypothetical protein KatS3mg095_0354 [Candidatus Parcubacteria bacterium]|nr:MAG: hypothetical protein KatS3mg095_0354 [Candidatus Parcubacteria bacterium]
MGFFVLLTFFLFFIYLAWQEQKEGNTHWAIIFIIAGFAFIIMAIISR